MSLRHSPGPTIDLCLGSRDRLWDRLDKGVLDETRRAIRRPT